MKLLYNKLKTIKRIRENKETCIRKFNEGGEAFANIKCAFNANILINNSGVLYNTSITSEYFFVPIEKIKEVQVKTGEELSKLINDKKIPIIGDLTFPQQSHFFLIINYIENDLEVEKNIDSKMATFAVTSILKARKEYIQNHPESCLEELEDIEESKRLNAELKTMDIPDQINKLFGLVEKGALSLDEFNQKKKELLLKM
jgi:hypothetical protein